MKHLIRILSIVFFMMGSGLLIWTIIPEGQVEKILIIDPEFSLFSEKMKCEEVQNLLGTEFTLNYPRSIRSGEYGVIQVEFIKDIMDENKINKDDDLGTCEISLEVWIEGEGVVIEPGNKIIKSYLNVPSQFIRFELFPINDQLIKGTLWISAVFPGDTGTGLERIPIFTIPFAFQVQSLFGLHAKGMRILSSFLIVLALGLVIFPKKTD